MKKTSALITTLALALCLAPIKEAWAELYIDIVSSPRKLPVAIMELEGPHGREISKIITEDLRLSGVFEPMDPAGFMEKNSEGFDPGNWVGSGAEAVVKGKVEGVGELVVTARLFDVVEGRLVMEKKYTAGKSLLRLMAHAAANDIYEKITGKKGVFRTKIAYITRQRDGNFKLNVTDWDGQRMRKLNVSERALLSPHWHPNGRSLTYTAERDRRWGIYSLDFATMKEETLLSMRGANIAGDYLPGGKDITLSSSTKGTSDIYRLNIKTKKLKRLTSGMGIEVSPTVSQDGKTIAYVSDRSGSPQIYTMDNMGYNIRRVTFEGKYNTSPVWSPQSDLIAFSGRYGGRNQIFTIWPNGNGLRMLTASGNNEEPSFSPDGRFIAFTSDRNGKRQVYVMNRDGSGQRRLSPRGQEAFNPSWSPR